MYGVTDGGGGEGEASERGDGLSPRAGRGGGLPPRLVHSEGSSHVLCDSSDARASVSRILLKSLRPNRWFMYADGMKSVRCEGGDGGETGTSGR